MPVFGLIGGSGLLKSKLAIFGTLTAQHVPTSAGTVIFHVGTIPGTDTTIVFCQRHAASPTAPYTQPHDINYAAIMLGMVHYRADVVIAIASVGTLHPDRIPCGSVAVPNDFYCPADLRPVYPDARGHFVPSTLSTSSVALCVSVASELLPARVAVFWRRSRSMSGSAGCCPPFS